MPRGGQLPATVTWESMTQYIDKEVGPIMERLDTHDRWHLAQATAAKRVIVTNLFNTISCLAAVAVVILDIALRR